MILKVGTNTKLGRGVATFSLPAVQTCPGRTKLCEKICYATHGFFNMPKVKQSLTSAKAVCEQPGFIEAVSGELRRRRSIKAVRLHPAGDFYSVEYLRKWIQIAKANPNTKFWAYTKSWRIPEFAKDLKEFGELPNVICWASVDSETRKLGQQPPSWMRLADIVAEWKDTANKSYMQCPNLKDKRVTCVKCAYCFRPAGPRKMHVAFKEH